MPGPANGQACWRGEPAGTPSQQVMASAVTGPDPVQHSRCGQAPTLAPVQVPVGVQQPPVPQLLQAVFQAVIAPPALFTLSCPPGTGTRLRPRQRLKLTTAPRAQRAIASPGRPGGRTPLGRAAPRRLLRAVVVGLQPSPGSPRMRDGGIQHSAAGPRQQLPGARVGPCRLGVPLTAPGEVGVSRWRRAHYAGRSQFLGNVAPAGKTPLPPARTLRPRAGAV